MNTQLIADAVRNSRGHDEATVWDRLFAFWFRRLVYTQIWEDPEADLAALQLPLGSTIVTISSGGCNALSYLTAKPAQVYAIDLNEAHLSLLKLKLAGLRAFSRYADFWRFFGEGASPSNSELYHRRLRPVLDADARAYWDKRNLIGRPRHAYFTDGFYRHGMLGRFIGLAHLLAKCARIDLEALLNGKTDAPERIQALDRVHRLFHSPLARLMTGTPLCCSASVFRPSSARCWSGRAAWRSASSAVLLVVVTPTRQLFCVAGAASVTLVPATAVAALLAERPV
jgi:S-adenosylmethionine-diacylglycerol 3-amino-3-carboxypropyl transferase